MSMSLKQEIETWVEALEHYDDNRFEQSLAAFDNIADTSKILFNCGVIHATLGQHEKAVECYQKAVRLDQYLAIAYFQQGVSNFLIGDFEEALANFNDTLLYLRGNNFIDYEQLGLKFKLHSCEVLFNRGLCYIYLSQMDAGMDDLIYAAREKATPDHDVIDEAIKERASDYTVFSIPVGILYRPNSSKVKNLKTKDYLGKARLIASTEKNNTHTGFSGTENRRVLIPVVQDDRSPESISYAATNLVRTDLVSRSRQQSEPPLRRNMFPPTPPPEEQQQRTQAAREAPPLSTSSPASNRSIPVRRGPFPPSRQPTLQEEPSADIPAATKPTPLLQDLSTRNVVSQNSPPPPQDSSPQAHALDEVASATTNENPTQRYQFTAELDTVAPSRSREPLFVLSPQAMGAPEKPRLGTLRTASEPRGPSIPRSAMRSNRYQNSQDRLDSINTTQSPISPSRGRLFGETIPSPGHEADIDEAPEELYDIYNHYGRNNNTRGTASDGRNRSRSRHQQRASVSSIYPSETETVTSGHSSLGDFEILNGTSGAPSARKQSSRRGTSQSRRPTMPTSNPSYSSNHSQATTISFGGSNGHSRSYSYSTQVPYSEIRNIRIKMHAQDETRYLMINSTVAYLEVVEKIREKLGAKGDVKIKIKDEGDLVTLGDRDDWDMALQQSRADARKTGEDMGRLEVWVHEIQPALS